MQIPWYILLYMYCSQTVFKHFNLYRHLTAFWPRSEACGDEMCQNSSELGREELRNVGSQKPRATCAEHTVLCICKNLTVCAIFVIMHRLHRVVSKILLKWNDVSKVPRSILSFMLSYVLKIIFSLKLLKCIMIETENKAYYFFKKSSELLICTN